ncbi:M56 family metallopeptidase [Pseudoflavitalea sp. X16]|uniref:M56 family metallopeptidase n=1 Tax=Paraflavitalea devenefica TaxID=2716334 RepID=UPI0014207BE8|nr:M56 family metallopeptidase [Paraflavitalea devenefica]NII25353.1 M56 family metallopeptidase [Paraflavitalea devenefica]
MSPFFIALVKINLVLVLFALAYYGILRRLTFYTANRAFLLFGIGFAMLYPLIDLPPLFAQETAMAVVPEFTQQLKTMVTKEVMPAYMTWVFLIFYIGLAVMLFRIVRQSVSLYRIHRQSAPALIGDVPVRLINVPMSPFSFGKHIYINPAEHSEEELLTIVAHEHIHVRQRHTVDVLLAELSFTLNWFNPAVWIIRKAIKENLEFIADEQVLEAGADKKAYQYSLLHIGALSTTPLIANDFNLVDLKKRIRMMNVRRSSKLTLGRYALLLPVLLLITLAFSITVRQPLQAAAKALEEVILTSATTVNEPATSPNTVLRLSTPDAQTAANRSRTGRQPSPITIRPLSNESNSQEQEAATNPPVRELVGQPLRQGIQGRLYETPVTAAADKLSLAGIPNPTGRVTSKTVAGVPVPDEVIVTGFLTTRRVNGIRVTPPADSSKGKLREVTVIGRGQQ